MPTLPKSRRTKQSIQPSPVPWVDKSSESAVYQGISNFAKSAGNVAGAIADFAKFRQSVQADRDYLDAIHQSVMWEDHIREKETEWLNLKGQNARGITKKVQEYYDAEIDKHKAGLTSKGAQEGFFKLTRPHRETTLNKFANYERDQDAQFKNQVEGELFNSLSRSVRENPLSYDQASKDIEIFLRSNHSEAEANLLIEKYGKDLRVGQLDALLKIDDINLLKTNEIYLDEHKKEIGQELYGIYKDKFRNRMIYLRNIQITENNLKKMREKEAQEKAFAELRKSVYNQIEADDIDSETIMALRKQVLDSDLPIKGEHNAAWLINRIDEKVKELESGGTNSFKEYDPSVEAELRRMVNTDPEDLEMLGGKDYIWSLVGRGKNGGITSAQAEALQKKLETGEPKLRTAQFKFASRALEIMRKNNQFIDDPDSEDNIELLENDTIAAKIYDELEEQYMDPDNKRHPMDILKELSTPYMEKQAEGFWKRLTGGGFFENIGEFYGSDLKSEPDPKRQEAIDILKSNGYMVNEDTIKKIMDQLNAE